MRLVIPLIGGILISDTLENTGNLTHLILCVLVPVLVLCFVSFINGDRLSRVYGFSLSLAFFLTGAMLYDIHMKRVNVEWPVEREDYYGILTDTPYERNASYRLDLTLTDSRYSGARIYLYVPKDSLVKELVPGEKLFFNGRIDNPQSDAVPGFDYRKYLYRQGVSGTLWVNSRYWHRTASEPVSSVRISAVKIRQSMFKRYGEWGMEGKTLAIVSAVSLGYRKELDESTRELYSASGASHLLAVSGLHVGIMYSLIYFLFPVFFNLRHFRWLRDLIVIVFMWAFALLTGMPISIIRSVVMFSMLTLCGALGRDSSSVNTLSFAALVMLVADPAALFDIGFRLSFCAVLSILLFGPMLKGLCNPRTRVGKWILELLSVSIAAQIGTAPMVIFSFTGFPTYFMLTNLLSIPVITVIVCICLSLWAFSWFTPLRIIIVKSLTMLTGILDDILSFIVSLPYSRIDVSIDREWKVWALYGMILLLYFWLKEKRSRYFVEALSIVAIWSILETV